MELSLLELLIDDELEEEELLDDDPIGPQFSS